MVTDSKRKQPVDFSTGCPLNATRNRYILLADEISGIPSSRLRAVYRAGGAGANNEYTPNTKKELNSAFLLAVYALLCFASGFAIYPSLDLKVVKTEI
jgi:hypothetical protein